MSIEFGKECKYGQEVVVEGGVESFVVEERLTLVGPCEEGIEVCTGGASLRISVQAAHVEMGLGMCLLWGNCNVKHADTPSRHLVRRQSYALDAP